MAGSNAAKLMKYALQTVLSKETGTFNAILNKVILHLTASKAFLFDIYKVINLLTELL